ncbi:MAG: protein TolR [Pelagimonas sp.]|jgi:biopolymer transport protein TolR|nr:protein TolR [Pelagimonas sp.]
MGAGVVKSGGGGGNRRRRRRRSGASQPMSEINVTPFVDVMLVLLIIFMVAAPLLTVGVPVELPKTAAQALPQETEEPLTVSLTAEGEILLQSTAITRDDLVPRLRAIAAERSDDRVYLRADGTVPYEEVAQVMGALNAGGFSSIGLVTDIGGPALNGTGQ